MNEEELYTQTMAEIVEDLNILTQTIVSAVKSRHFLHVISCYTFNGIRILPIGEGKYRFTLEREGRISVLPPSLEEAGTRGYMNEEEIFFTAESISDYITGLFNFLRALGEKIEQVLTPSRN